MDATLQPVAPDQPYQAPPGYTARPFVQSQPGPAMLSPEAQQTARRQAELQAAYAAQGPVVPMQTGPVTPSGATYGGSQLHTESLADRQARINQMVGGGYHGATYGGQILYNPKSQGGYGGHMQGLRERQAIINQIAGPGYRPTRYGQALTPGARPTRGSSGGGDFGRYILPILQFLI